MKQLRDKITSLYKVKKRTKTVRYMFPAVLSFTALLGAAVIGSSDVSYVRLEASNQNVEAGSQFSIDVYAYAHKPVNAVDITLNFDPERVEVLGVDTGQSVLTIWTQEPIIENGKVMLQGGTFRRGFVEEHKVATLNLKAKQAGQSSLEATEVVLLAGDGEGTPVSVAEAIESKVSLYVYDENTNPDQIGIDVAVNVVTDLDGDGEVTLKDVSSFMSAWYNKEKVYDFNDDGRMSFADFSIILAQSFFN